MRDEVRHDLNQSAADFEHIVWPVVREHCPELRGGELRMVEGHSDDAVSHDLDVRAGIDAYQRGSFALRGITSRVQWWDNHQTFTIRTSRPNGTRTEYEKRLATLKRRDEGFFYPYWTIQAYLAEPGGPLLSVAVARTVELYLYIEQREHSAHPCTKRQAGNGGEWFLIVEWARYLQSGNYLFVYPGLTSEGSA